MKIYFVLLFISLISLHGCNGTDKETLLTVFSKSSSGQEYLQIKGKLHNRLEEGRWYYYNERGEIVQEGVYEQGQMVGEWIHTYSSFRDTVTWLKMNSKIDGFQFSLPASFSDYKSDNNKFVAIDTLTKDVFSIELYADDKATYLEDYSKDLKEQIEREGLQMLSYQLYKMKVADGQIYCVDRIVMAKNTTLAFSSNIYVSFCDIDFIYRYTGAYENRERTSHLLGEIFGHSFWEKSRIVNPYAEATFLSKYSD